MFPIYVEQVDQPPAGPFARQDVEPRLTAHQLVIRSGSWPGRAVIQSTVVLHTDELIAVHIQWYPRSGFTELWRYYTLRGSVWQRVRLWQKLPIVARVRILEAYQQNAPAFAVHPGNIPGQSWRSRAVKRGPTYLLVAMQDGKYVSLLNAEVTYVLGEQKGAEYAHYTSYPNKEILLIQWQRGSLPCRMTEPFQAAVVACDIGGEMCLLQGRVKSAQLRPRLVVEQFEAIPGPRENEASSGS